MQHKLYCNLQIQKVFKFRQRRNYDHKLSHDLSQFLQLKQFFFHFRMNNKLDILHDSS